MAHRQPAANNGSDRFNVRALIQILSTLFRKTIPLNIGLLALRGLTTMLSP
ncbi:hypothetical protein RYX36_012775 [Vicia faba]